MQGKEIKPIWFQFLNFSLGQSKPSQNVLPENLKCEICSHYVKKGEQQKFRISKKPRAKNLQKAFSYFKNDAYTHIAYLVTLSKIFVGDLYRHKSCYANYIGKWKELLQYLTRQTFDGKPPRKRNIFKNYFPFIKAVIDKGRELSLSGIRNMISWFHFIL